MQKNKKDVDNSLCFSIEDLTLWPNTTEKSKEAHEAIKSLGRKLAGEGASDSPIARFINLFLEEVREIQEMEREHLKEGLSK